MLLDLGSRPGTWRIHPKELEIVGCGRDKVARILKELKDRRFLVEDRMRDEFGRFRGTSRKLYKHPQTDLPDTAKPHPANPHLQKQQKKEKQESLPPPVEKQQQERLLLKVPEKGLEIFAESKLQQLVAEYGYQRVLDCIEHVFTLGGRVSRRAGFVIRALERNWLLPVDIERAAKARENDPERYISGEYADFIDY